MYLTYNYHDLKFLLGGNLSFQRIRAVTRGPLDVVELDRGYSVYR